MSRKGEEFSKMRKAFKFSRQLINCLGEMDGFFCTKTLLTLKILVTFGLPMGPAALGLFGLKIGLG